MSDTVGELAKKLLEYMRLDMSVGKADATIGMGALDNRVAERSARLFLDGYGSYIVFTGGLGKVTKETHTETEAERFEAIALKMGVPKDKIFLEKEASNSGENITFAEEFLKEKGISSKSILIVTKPYMKRRIWATFEKQWGDSNTEVFVTSPQITYEEHFNNDIPKTCS